MCGCVKYPDILELKMQRAHVPEGLEMLNIMTFEYARLGIGLLCCKVIRMGDHVRMYLAGN